MTATLSVRFSHSEGIPQGVKPVLEPGAVVFREPQPLHRFAELAVDPATGRLTEHTEDRAMSAVSHGGQAALWLMQVADPSKYRNGMSAGELQGELADGVLPDADIVAVNGIRHWLMNLRQVGLIQQEKRGRAVLFSPLNNQRALATIGLFDRLSEDYSDTGIVVPRLFGKPQTGQNGRSSQLTRMRYVRSVMEMLTAGSNNIIPVGTVLEDVQGVDTDPSYARDLLARLAGAGLFSLDRPGLNRERTSELPRGSVGVSVSDVQLDYMRELVGGLDAIALGAERFTNRHAQIARETASDTTKFTRLYEDFIPAGNERVSSAKELEDRVWAVLTSDPNAGKQWTATELAAAVADSFEPTIDSGHTLKGRVNVHKTTIRTILEPLVEAGIIERQSASRNGAFLYTLV